MAIVKVDDKGGIQLSKELRKASGVQKNDLLIIQSLSKGKILLEKIAGELKIPNYPLDWLLTHPGKMKSVRLRNEIKKRCKVRGN